MNFSIDKEEKKKVPASSSSSSSESPMDGEEIKKLLLQWTPPPAHFSDLKDLAEGFCFSGFDPLLVLSRMMSIADNNLEQVKEDASIIALYALQRGTKPTAGTMRMRSKAAAAKIMAIVRMYNIKEARVGKGYASNDLTISRVASTVAHVSAFFLKNKICRPRVHVDGLPEYYSFSAGGSLIPQSQAPMKVLWLQWHVEHSKLITPGSREFNKEEAEKYGRIVLQSNYYTEKQKQGFFDKLSA